MRRIQNLSPSGLFRRQSDAVKPGPPPASGLSRAERRRQRRAALRRERSEHKLAQEQLESRIALAVYVDGYVNATDRWVGEISLGATQAQPAQIPGRLIIASDDSSDVFIRQVASVRQNLIVSGNSSFLGYQIVDAVDETYRQIFVTNGTPRIEGPLVPDNDGERQTFFLLDHEEVRQAPDPGRGYAGMEGQISVVQDDGTTSVWSFAWDVPAGGLLFTSGPFYVPPALDPGHIYPTRIEFIDLDSDPDWAQSTLIVTWSDVVGPTNQATLAIAEYLTFDSDVGFTIFNESANVPGGFGPRSVGVSTTVDVTLPGALATLQDGIGERQSLGVVPGTLRGGISFSWGNRPISLPPFQADADGILRFGGDSRVFVPLFPGFSRNGVAVTGRVSTTGIVSLTFQRIEEVGVGDGGIFEFVNVSDQPGPQIPFVGGPGNVVISGVEYLTYTRDAEPNEVTFMAGQDISRNVTVDLLTPDSTVKIESPVVVAQSGWGDTRMTDEGALDFRATNIYVQAEVSSPNRLSVGRSQVARERLSIPVDDRNPFLASPSMPSLYATVGQGFPAVRQARALVEINANGQVVALRPLPGNEGYGYDPDNPPTVVVDAPATGPRATAVAIVAPDGSVTGYRVTNAGTGYNSNWAGVRPRVSVTPPIPQQLATARVAEIDAATGRVVKIDVLDRGYRYHAPPRVVIAAPDLAAFGVQATARAILDNEGRVQRIEIVNPGFGYVERPNVTLAEPSPPAMAELFQIEASVEADIYELYVGDDFGTDTPRGRFQASANGTISTRAVQVQIQSLVAADANSLQQVALQGTGTNGEFPAGFNPAGAAITGFGIREGTRILRYDATSRTATLPAGSLSPSTALPSPALVSVGANSLYLEATTADVFLSNLVNVRRQSYLFNSPASVASLAPFKFTTRSEASGMQSGTIEGQVVDIVLGNDAPTPLVGASSEHVVDLRTRVDSLRVKAVESLQDPQGPYPYRLSIEEQRSISIDGLAASSLPISVTAGETLSLTGAVDTYGDVLLNAESDDGSPTALDVTAPIRTRFGQVSIAADSVEVRNSLAVSSAAVADGRQDVVLNARGGSIRIQGLVSAPNEIFLEQVNRIDSIERVLIESADQDLSGGGTQQRIVLRRQDGSPLPTTFNPVGILLTGDPSQISVPSEIIQWDRGESTATIAVAPGGTPPVLPILPGSLPVVVRLSQALSTVIPGEIDGDLARIVADEVRVFADGKASLRTDVNRLTARAGTGFTLSELGDVEIPLLTSGGLVSLEALGVDPGSRGANPVALSARLVDVNQLTVNVPNGSARIDANTDRDLIVGDAATIQDRGDRAPSMAAAGDVTIRSQSGSIILLDAPIAGASARAVRVATSGPLPGTTTYMPGNPGVVPSSLSGAGSINGLDWGTDSADRKITLAVGDLVLVKDQSAGRARENGVYRVASVGGGVFGSQRWRLVRDAGSDTIADMPNGTLVQVVDGASAGSVFQIGYDSILPTLVERVDTNNLQFPELFTGFDLLKVGGIVNGVGIAPNSVITAIDPVARVVTLGVVDPGQVFTQVFTGGLSDVSVASVVGDTITLGNLAGSLSPFSDFADLAIGQEVVGAGILPGAVITRIDPVGRRIDVATTLLGPTAVTMDQDPIGATLRFDRSFSKFNQLKPGQQVQLFDGEANLRATRTILEVDPLDPRGRSVTLDGGVDDEPPVVTARIWTPGAMPAQFSRPVETPRVSSLVLAAHNDLKNVRVGQLFELRDADGNPVSRDADGNPVSRPQPVTSVTIRVDDQGNVVGDVTIGFGTLEDPTVISRVEQVEFRGPEELSFGVAAPGAVPVDWNTWTAVPVGTSTLLLPDFDAFDELTLSMEVTGSGIPDDAVIVAFNAVARTIQIDGVLTANEVSTVSFGIGPPARYPASDTLRLDPGFTNYERLFPGQPVYGAGIAEGAVIVSVDRITRTVTLTPGSVVTERGPIGVTQRGSQASPYYPELFDDWIELEDSFNDFAEIRIGQRMELLDAAGDVLKVVQVTGVDPRFRTVGLENGSLNGLEADLEQVRLLPVSNVRFGVVEGVGSGKIDLLLEPVGLTPITVAERPVTMNIGSDFAPRTVSYVVSTDGRTNAVTGSLGKMIDAYQRNDTRTTQVDVAVLAVELQLVLGEDGAPILDENGDPIEIWILTLDPLFTAYERLERLLERLEDEGGEAVVSGTPGMFTRNARLVAVNPENRSVTLSDDSLSDLAIEDRSRVAVITLPIETSNPEQRQEFLFGNWISGDIELQQELPAITTSMTIDGSLVYAGAGTGAPRPVSVSIDGQRIIRNRRGGVVTGGQQINGFEIVGADADGSAIKQLSIGGFSQGSAIRIDGASNVLVESVNVGRTVDNSRLPNARGITVDGGTARNNTILNSTVVGGLSAGVVVDGGEATYVIGGSIGTATIDNPVGIFVADKAEKTSIGANPILPNQAVATSAGFVRNSDRITLPANAFNQPLLGLQFVFDESRVVPPVPVGTTIIGVDTAARLVYLSNPATVTATVNFQLGHVAKRVRKLLEDGSTPSFNTLVLSASVPLDDVFVGQRISGRGLPAGVVTITSIDREAREVGISRPFATLGTDVVTFASPPQTVVQGNRTGILLRGKESRVTNTAVFENTGNGIVVGTAGQQIGSTHEATGEPGVPSIALASWPVAVSLSASSREIRLPSTFTAKADLIPVGTRVFGPGIVPGTTVAARTTSAAGVLTSITLSQSPQLPAGQSSLNSTISFGVQVDGKPQQIPLPTSGGKGLFVGQDVHHPGLPEFTEIVAIRLVGDAGDYVAVTAPVASLPTPNFAALAGQLWFAERSGTSNRIYGNGEYGIAVQKGGESPEGSGRPTSIVANYFGLLSETNEVTPNRLGAIRFESLSDSTPPVPDGLKFRPVTRVDFFGNKYGLSQILESPGSGGGGGGGGNLDREPTVPQPPVVR